MLAHSCCTAVKTAGHQIQGKFERTCLQGTLQCLAQHHLVRSGALHVVAIAACQDAIHVAGCLVGKLVNVISETRKQGSGSSSDEIRHAAVYI